jgi:hypothetical protein
MNPPKPKKGPKCNLKIDTGSKEEAFSVYIYLNN